MTRLTAEAAEASVDFDADLLRFDRGVLAVRGFVVLGVRLFRPRLVAEFFAARFNGARFGATRLMAPRFAFARVFAMHSSAAG
jgi:hypothetical protein